MPKSAKQRRIEFVFPNRMLAYDCATCTDKCCNGEGFSLEVHKELVQILDAHPALAPFLGRDARSSDTLRVDNFRPGCYFLDPNELCAIERDMGREAKPLLCRLFPVNKLFVVGDTILVDVHNLCTLGVGAYSAPTANAIDHEPLLEEFSESIRTTVAQDTRAENETSLEPFVEALLAVSRPIRDQASHYFESGNFHDYVVFQSERTEEALPRGCDRARLIPPVDVAAIDRMIEQMAEFFELRLEPLGEAEELRLDRTLIAMACSARHRFLAGRAASIVDEQDFFRRLTLLPWILVALEFLYRAALSLNPARNGFVTLSDICTKEYALLHVLALFPRTPAHTGMLPKKLELLPPLKKPFFDFLKRLTESSQTREPRTFHRLLMSLDLPRHDKAAFLRALDAYTNDLMDWCPAGHTPSK